MILVLIAFAVVALFYLARPPRCPSGDDGIHDYRSEHEGRVAICTNCGHMEDLR